MSAPVVVSMGNMLVEVMREQLDVPLDRPGTFIGPYPSGDTPIYVDAVARLGVSAGFVGAVGDDAFGACLLRRLRSDGVDVSHVKVLPDRATGVAFVSYFSDGSRRFLYHWKDAAAGQIGPSDVSPKLIAEARWLHLTGCNLAVCESARLACLRALELLPPGACLSFDPNLRPEVLGVEEIRRLCAPVLERANVFLPSRGEAAMFTGAATDEEGCRRLASQGKTVALKLGASGCRLFTGAEQVSVAGFDVEETDPTGAGDCYSAAFTVAMLEGMALADAGRFANVVGALAVSRRGPMEGAPTRGEVETFLARHPGR